MGDASQAVDGHGDFFFYGLANRHGTDLTWWSVIDLRCLVDYMQAGPYRWNRVRNTCPGCEKVSVHDGRRIVQTPQDTTCRPNRDGRSCFLVVPTQVAYDAGAVLMTRDTVPRWAQHVLWDFQLPGGALP